MITQRRIGAVLLTGMLLVGGLASAANAATDKPNDTVQVCGLTVTQKMLKAAGIKPGQDIDCTEPEAGVPAVPAIPATPGEPTTPGEPSVPSEPSTPGEAPVPAVPGTPAGK